MPIRPHIWQRAGRWRSIGVIGKLLDAASEKIDAPRFDSVQATGTNPAQVIS